MIRKLRLRLTLIFTLLTCLIFLTAIGITWYLSASSYRDNAQALFLSNVNAVKEHLLSGEVLRDSWLNEQEQAYSSIIFIEDAGVQLHFNGAYITGERRHELIELAKNKSQASQKLQSGLEQLSASDSDIEPFMLYDSDKNPYLFYETELRLNKTATVSLRMIGDYLPVQTHLKRSGLFYCIIGLIGCLLLCVSNLFMVHIATKPITESLKRQNEFIAAASHELRSPLTVMKASLDAASTLLTHSKTAASPITTENASAPPEDLKQENLHNSEILRLLNTANTETDRLKKLTDDLLTMTTGDADSWHLNMTNVNLDTMLIEIFESYTPLCRQYSHPFSLQLTENNLPPVCIDAERITQLIGILLHNALDYTPLGTPIELSASVTHNHVSISVIDHGPGIPDAEKKNIFRRFYRADQSRSDKKHFGLGLSVAKQIADVHHITLEVYDTPHGGATFRFILK